MAIVVIGKDKLEWVDWDKIKMGESFVTSDLEEVITKRTLTGYFSELKKQFQSTFNAQVKFAAVEERVVIIPKSLCDDEQT